ncbi:START-like domain-containing protein [Porphyromonadaceae bacterium W3.11]|nr:START-like domain-containing protein [Porphyromonadaceae bacterium W3.11]
MRKSNVKFSGYRKEFFLDSASAQSVWNQISTSRGLSEWFAPMVDITGNDLHVYWDDAGDDRKALIVKLEPQRLIKWVWTDDPDSYLSMEIVFTELSRTISLLVDDHDEGLDPETLDELWTNHMERLLSTLGLS